MWFDKKKNHYKVIPLKVSFVSHLITRESVGGESRSSTAVSVYRPEQIDIEGRGEGGHGRPNQVSFRGFYIVKRISKKMYIVSFYSFLRIP